MSVWRRKGAVGRAGKGRRGGRDVDQVPQIQTPRTRSLCVWPRAGVWPHREDASGDRSSGLGLPTASRAWAPVPRRTLETLPRSKDTIPLWGNGPCSSGLAHTEHLLCADTSTTCSHNPLKGPGE